MAVRGRIGGSHVTPPGGHIVDEESVALPPRPILNFIGVGVTASDDPVGNKTDVTIPGAAVEAGWTDAGTFIRLTTSTDQVTVGASATAGRKLTVVNEGTNLGIRIEALAASDNALDARVGAEGNPRLAIDSDGAIRLGPGTSAADLRLRRTAASELTVDANGAAGVDVIPATDATGNLGRAGRRWASVYAQTVVSGDLAFDDPTCARCGRGFAVGQDVLYRVRAVENGVTYTVPLHLRCPRGAQKP